MNTQGELVGDNDNPEPSVLSGLVVNMPRACNCGSSVMKAGPGRGAHLASLRCAACGRHCGWISTPVANFLLDIIARFGRPTKPIEVRPCE